MVLQPTFRAGAIGFISVALTVSLAACAPEKSTTTASPSVSPSSVEKSPTTPPATPAPISSGTGAPLARTTVLWADYRAGFKTDIDSATSFADCKALDSLYGEAKSKESADTQRTGHSSQALLTYIDEGSKLAKCL